MNEITIVVRCPAQGTELVTEGAQAMQYIVEDCVSRALLELLGTVYVETVSIVLLAAEQGDNSAA